MVKIREMSSDSGLLFFFYLFMIIFLAYNIGVLTRVITFVQNGIFEKITIHVYICGGGGVRLCKFIETSYFLHELKNISRCSVTIIQKCDENRMV